MGGMVYMELVAMSDDQTITSVERRFRVLVLSSRLVQRLRKVQGQVSV